MPVVRSAGAPAACLRPVRVDPPADRLCFARHIGPTDGRARRTGECRLLAIALMAQTASAMPIELSRAR